MQEVTPEMGSVAFCAPVGPTLTLLERRGLTMYLKTAAAAKHVTSLGRPVSAHTLRKLRQRGTDDPGEPGPEWVRDPLNGYCLYSTEGLTRWVDAWRSRLATTAVTRPSHLAAAVD
jgi:hypothetical protein